MIRLTTASGAEYLIDGLSAQRLTGPYSPGIDYVKSPDGAWEPLASEPVIKVGQPLFLIRDDGSVRVTTPVAQVEDQP